MALGIFIGLAIYGALDTFFGLGDTLRADATTSPRYRSQPDIELVTFDSLLISQTYCTPNFDITINPN